MKKSRITASLKTISHQKQKLLQMINSSGKTVDQAFEEQRQNWEKMLRLISNIDKDLKKQKKLEGFTLPMAGLAESFLRFFSDEGSQDQTPSLGVQYKEAVEQITAVVKEYSDKVEELKNFVQDLIKRLNSIKPKIQERDNLQLDFDKWKNTLKTLQEKPTKDPTKLAEAEQKFNYYKDVFETANTTLIQEIGDLYENRFVDFEEAYSLLITSQFNLFSKISNIYQNIDVQSVVSKYTPGSSGLPRPSSSNVTGSTKIASMERNLQELEQTLEQLKGQKPKTVIYMKAQFDLDEAKDEGDLTFKENDKIKLLEKYEDSDWWKGEINGKVGLFPSNYTEMLDPIEDEEDKVRIQKQIQETTSKIEDLKVQIEKEKEEERKRKEEEERKRKEEEEKKKKEEEERKRKEEEERKKKEEEEKKKKEEEEKKKKEEEEKKKKEEEDKKRKEEEEKKKKAAEEAAKKQKEEEEKKKKAAEESKKQTSATSTQSSPKKGIAIMKALFDFTPSEPTELGFKEGDLITLLEKDPESDWWKGELNGKVGDFPSNYTELVKEL